MLTYKTYTRGAIQYSPENWPENCPEKCPKLSTLSVQTPIFLFFSCNFYLRYAGLHEAFFLANLLVQRGDCGSIEQYNTETAHSKDVWNKHLEF